MITIKKYDNSEEVQFNKLLDLNFEEKGLLNIVKESKFKFAYSAYVEDKLVGVIFGWSNRFHPNCTYFRILHNPFYARDGVSEKLLAEVEAIETLDFPLQTSIWETAIDVKEMYKGSGFKEIRRTYMPNLHVFDLKEDVFSVSKSNNRIKSLAEILSNNELMEKLIFIVKRNYEDTHQVNPVANVGLDEWEKLILASDVLIKGSYIYLDAEEKNIVAYSFLHESDSDNAYDLGWCGCSSVQYKRIIPELVWRQIEYTINHNVKTIIGEFDTTDNYAMEVLKAFPFAPCPTWITYRKV